MPSVTRVAPTSPRLPSSWGGARYAPQAINDLTSKALGTARTATAGSSRWLRTCAASTRASRQPPLFGVAVRGTASALRGAWSSRRRPTNRGRLLPASSTKSFAITSRRFARRRQTSATARSCPAWWSRSFATSYIVAPLAEGSPGFGVQVVGSTGSCRSLATAGVSVRVAVGVAWPSAPPISLTRLRLRSHTIRPSPTTPPDSPRL